MMRDSLRWDAVDSGGWQYLVGALPSARLLYYDVGAGAVALLLAGLWFVNWWYCIPIPCAGARYTIKQNNWA